ASPCRARRRCSAFSARRIARRAGAAPRAPRRKAAATPARGASAPGRCGAGRPARPSEWAGPLGAAQVGPLAQQLSDEEAHDLGQAAPHVAVAAGSAFTERKAPTTDPRRDWTGEQKAKHAAETNLCPTCNRTLCIKTTRAGPVVTCSHDCGGTYPDHPWLA